MQSWLRDKSNDKTDRIQFKTNVSAMLAARQINLLALQPYSVRWPIHAVTSRTTRAPAQTKG